MAINVQYQKFETVADIFSKNKIKRLLNNLSHDLDKILFFAKKDQQNYKSSLEKKEDKS